MIKVFEDFDLARVGHFQSVLEAAGIRTLLKNQYMSSVMGEIPFVEVLPELWVLDDRDLPRARQVIGELLARPAAEQPAWTCPACGVEVEGVFSRCWKCGGTHTTPESH